MTYPDEIECTDCGGTGEIFGPNDDCFECNGTGWRAPTDDERDNMAEAAYDRQFEGEPLMSARERDEMQARRDAQWGVK